MPACQPGNACAFDETLISTQSPLNDRHVRRGLHAIVLRLTTLAGSANGASIAASACTAVLIM